MVMTARTSCRATRLLFRIWASTVALCRVPQKQTDAEASVVISFDEYERIKRNAVRRTGSATAQDAAARKAQRQEQQAAAEARRAHLQSLDEQRRARGEKMNDLEQEEQEREHEIRTQARLQMEEQEDEIKRLNEAILQAKCYAILDAQVAEKDEIHHLHRSEERRLDEVRAGLWGIALHAWVPQQRVSSSPTPLVPSLAHPRFAYLCRARILAAIASVW